MRRTDRNVRWYNGEQDDWMRFIPWMILAAIVYVVYNFNIWCQ